MPVTIRKVKGGHRVSTPGGLKAKKTTWAKANAQKRIIEAADTGLRPKRRIVLKNKEKGLRRKRKSK